MTYFPGFRSLALVVVLAAASITLSACQNANEVAKKIGVAPANALELRALQSRRFSTRDQVALLSASTQTLQDLGYTVTESSLQAGVLVATKQRDAKETGQVAGQIVLTVMLALLGSYHNPTWDHEQTINVTLVSTPIENSSQTELRVTFDRHLINNHGQLWRAELLSEPALYQEFFDKVSASVFLEAEKI